MAKTKISTSKSRIVSSTKVPLTKSSKSPLTKISISDSRKTAEKQKDEKSVRGKEIPPLTGSKVDPLDRAEAGLNAVVAALNQQMSTALDAIMKIVQVRGDHAKVVHRTVPIDRATAAFRRLIAEVVDNQLVEIMGPLVALRNEMTEHETTANDMSMEMRNRIIETLDHVFVLAGVQSFQVRIGESFDSLIHMAVRETRRDNLADGVVVEQFQPGYRFANGMIISPAKVSVNRR